MQVAKQAIVISDHPGYNAASELETKGSMSHCLQVMMFSKGLQLELEMVVLEGKCTQVGWALSFSHKYDSGAKQAGRTELKFFIVPK